MAGTHRSVRSTGLIPRRRFLQFGSLLAGGLALPDILRTRTAAAESGQGRADTAVIFVNLGGGPTQFETYDPKPDAPQEYRGPTQAISTKVPGVSFCELLPEHARIADRLAIVRSVSHQQASHIAQHIVETGYDLRSALNSRTGEMPSVGAVVSRVRGRGRGGLPAHISVPKAQGYSGPHWLGAEHQYFAVDNDPNVPEFRVDNLALLPGLTSERLQDRRSLLTSLGEGAAFEDLDGSAPALDEFHGRAFDLITGTAAQRAFDIGREPDPVRDRYGRNPLGQRLLLARRLVESGVPFVHVRTFDWDDHTGIEARMKARCPQYDRGMAALVEDLHERSLSERVLVVARGEFGRTPRVNVNAGRDHWPGVMSVLFAGGGCRMGQVVGASDETGARPVAAPYKPENVLAMVYRHLGIDPGLTFDDYSGRPRYILEEREPIRELL